MTINLNQLAVRLAKRLSATRLSRQLVSPKPSDGGSLGDGGSTVDPQLIKELLACLGDEARLMSAQQWTETAGAIRARAGLRRRKQN